MSTPSFAQTFRVGNSDRELGSSTVHPDGFAVINLSGGSVFVASGGLWTAGTAAAIPSVVVSTWTVISTIFASTPPSTDYTYYVNPTTGNDSNEGTTYDTASADYYTADAVSLSGSDSVGYLLSGTWYLYRKLNMTADEAQLAANLVTATADDF